MLVLQKLSGNTTGVKLHFLFHLGGHSKQAGDERYLSHDVPFFHPMHLSLPNHVHPLISHGLCNELHFRLKELHRLVQCSRL